MGKSSNKPASVDNIATQDEDISTSQEVIPVRYWAGTRRFALSWIDSIQGLLAAPNRDQGKKGGGGKKGSGSGSQLYDYYGGFLGLLGFGPVDTINGVLLDGKQIVTDLSLPDDWNEVTLDPDNDKLLHPFVGKLVAFKGTSTQVLSDGFAESWTTPSHPEQKIGPNPWASHPEYKGLSLLASRGFFLGTGADTAPNIEVVATRTPQVSTSIIAAIDNVTDDGQANVAAVLAELMMADYGLGLPEASLDAASWLLAGAYCSADKDRYFCSPLFEAQSDARTAIQQLCELFYASLYWTADGTIGVKLLKPGINPGGLQLIEAPHLTEKIRIDATGWQDVPTTVLVRYQDRKAYYKKREAKCDNLAAMRSRDSIPKTLTYEANHITRAAQAQMLAAELMKRNARPAGSVALSVRRGIAGTLGPGDKVEVDLDPEPSGAGMAQMCVVVDRRTDAFGPVKLTLIPDTLVEARPYSPDDDTEDDDARTCDPIDPDKSLVVPLPFVYHETPSVAVIAPRPWWDVVGFRSYFAVDTDGDSSVDDEVFADLGTQTGFAVQMTLDADASDTATAFDLTLTETEVGPDADMAGRIPDNELDAQGNKLLLILANVDGDGRIVVTDNLPELEFCSVVSRVAIDADSHTYTVLRARLGLPARSWTAASTPRAYIVPLENVKPLEHPGIVDILANGNPGYFRLVAYTRNQVDESSPVPEVSFTMPYGYTLEPVIHWGYPTGNVGYTDVAGDITPDVVITDYQGDFISLRVESVKSDGTGITTHYDITREPTDTMGWSDTLNFAAGTYTLTVRATDALGHVAVSSRTVVNATGSSVPDAPTFTPAGAVFGSSIKCTIGMTSAADTIEYWVGPPGSSAPSSGTTYTGTTYQVTLTTSARLWARITDSGGPTSSDWAFADFWQE